MQTFRIRPIEADDREQWQPLWQEYLTFFKTTLPTNISDLTWARFLDPVESMNALVAERDGVLLGIVHYMFHRSTWSQTYYCYLEDLYVAPAGRSAGIGRALIEAVEAEARRVNATRLYWLTHESNARAQALYDEMGDRSGFIHYRKSL